MEAEFEELLQERFLLATERICTLDAKNDIAAPFGDYFYKVSEFLATVLRTGADYKIFDEPNETWWLRYSFEELKEANKLLYADVLKDAYNTSYANPEYAVACLGEEYGALMAAIYASLRSVIGDVFSNKMEFVTAKLELFIEIYNMFEEEVPKYQEVKDTFYWFMSDYSDTIFAHNIVKAIVPEESFVRKVLAECEIDSEDMRYIFRFGYYVSDSVIATAKFINSLPEEKIDLIAETYTQGYKRGFEICNRDLSIKKTVQIRYDAGFERIIKRSAKIFADDMGLDATYAVSAKFNDQFVYDHRFDIALYLDKAFYERRMSVVRAVYQDIKDAAAVYAGPAVMEVFGETPFEPANKKECLKLSKKQNELYLKYVSKQREIMNEFVPDDETSFTIIAFPIPEIGDKFEEIFEEVIKINTLDVDVYREVQQAIIDALDKSAYVKVLGTNGNRTDLTVSLVDLKNPDKETKFENCLADVNIPLGEVFTSPKLKGTDGLLHVSEVYLRDLKYIDFQVEFRDGCVVDYNCANFDTEEANKNYIKENVLNNHDTLPMGEFAVGTNTVAYSVAKKYDIVYKMPILIVEKMGPHFALGDTCYSHSEDVPMYNPDGKEVIARENDFSLLRDTEPDKAYFNCHTDVTIPYHEIGEIALYAENGEKTVLIKDGRFVLPGTELLNEALED
ncbi:MAG: aminopeptidase [Lachnospiraceae bacterium]|nr:aminopeptidase [Lachnospiraceae bacterium]